MLKKTLLFCTILFFTDLLCNDLIFAYTYNKTTVGVLTVNIEKPEVMQKLDEPLEIKTVLKNNGDTPLKLKLTYSTIKTIEFVNSEQDKKILVQTSEVPAKSEKTIQVAVVGRTGTLSVHYPIYLTVEWEAEGVPLNASVVQPFESTITPNPNWQTGNPQLGQLIENVTDLILNTIPDQTGLVFADLLTYRAFWISDKETNQDKNKVHLLPVGWIGSDSVSAATVTRQPFTRNGVTRQTINMHPPYRNGSGIVGVEYRIKLPQTSPITFSCYGAMRDVAPPEPPTDGVTFKIVAVDGQQEKIVAEKHVIATTWEPIEADLTPFAGKEIVLRFVSDPGLKRNTTCDSCYWGDPVLFAGKKPIFAVPELLTERQSALFKECFATMKTGKEISKRTKIFPLDGGLRAVVTFGEYGFIDGKIALGSPEKFVVYDGVKISVKENPIAVFPTTLAAEKWIPVKKSATDEQNTEKYAYSWTQNIAIGNEKAVMKYSLWKNGTAIQFSVDCSEPAWISSVELGAANDAAEKVYFAHGYCVVKPKRFVMSADGQRLSTSHVGFEYPSGIAVLQASTAPPANLTVDPERKIATMVIRPGTTMTLLPGINGMFDCAVRYRPLNPKKAAPGVKTKAGRFCFDIWGGSYKRHNDIIDHAIRYGLTDSLFIVHDWQRYGYDNRLPDIWPPNTGKGTLAEMQEALKKCDEAGILYGLHDNYIDFYPDAEGYDFDLLSFERNGQPRKAWFNSGIDARSYQFRPDKFKPFLQRNLDLMIPELPQSCYFVDVFSSMNTVDFYDRNGNFHSRSETQQYWGECFDIIRERLTEASRPRQKLSEENRNKFYAPTISESGH
ncbi:MAG: hypothetical protein LBC02_00150, partial [Planctomycetaceae bacterium]|nr:hypothetical protein [Planctomycetaceae bacterium]